MHNKKFAFSLVEIIIAIAIIVLLSVILMATNQGYKDNIDNTKVVTDIETINNALESYEEENNSLPMPGGNINFFTIDTTYAHSYEDNETFGVYGSITEDTLPKKYLNILPLDPRTSSYYAYGKTKGTAEIVANQFEIASVQILEGVAIAKVSGNYTAEAGPYNLIREYNGSNFVFDKSKINLPYNPDELVMVVTDANGVIYREGDTITTSDIETKELFFSDGSVSILGTGSTLTLNKLNFPTKNNLNTVVKLALGVGTIWTKATHLNDDSSFEVYTTDSTAAVRGTIFGVTKDDVNNQTETIVIEGAVNIYEARKVNVDENILDENIELNIEDYDVTEKIEITVEKDAPIKTITVEVEDIVANNGVPSITPTEILTGDTKLEEIEIIIESYTPAKIIRDEETNTTIIEEGEIATLKTKETINKIFQELFDRDSDSDYRIKIDTVYSSYDELKQDILKGADSKVDNFGIMHYDKEVAFCKGKTNDDLINAWINNAEESYTFSRMKSYIASLDTSDIINFEEDNPCKISCNIGALVGEREYDKGNKEWEECEVEIDFASDDIGGLHSIEKTVPNGTEVKIEFNNGDNEEEFEITGGSVEFKDIDVVNYHDTIKIYINGTDYPFTKSIVEKITVSE